MMRSLGGALRLARIAFGIGAATPIFAADAANGNARADGGAGVAVILARWMAPAPGHASGWRFLSATALLVDRRGDLITGCRELFPAGRPVGPERKSPIVLGFVDEPERLYSAVLVGCDRPHGIAVLHVDDLSPSRRPFFERPGARADRRYRGHSR